MICCYTTNYQDFKNAQHLYYRTKKLGGLRWAFWVWIVPALGIAAAVLLAFDMFLRHFSFKPVTGGVLGALAWFGLFIMLMRPINMRRMYKQMKNGRPETQPLELEITDTELVSRVPGLSEGRFFRSAIITFAEDDDLMLLFVGAKQFLILPKRAFETDQLAVVRSWLSQGGA